MRKRDRQTDTGNDRITVLPMSVGRPVSIMFALAMYNSRAIMATLMLHHGYSGMVSGLVLGYRTHRFSASRGRLPSNQNEFEAVLTHGV